MNSIMKIHLRKEKNNWLRELRLYTLKIIHNPSYKVSLLLWEEILFEMTLIQEVNSQLKSTNSTSVAIIEVDKYLQEGLIPRHENPLKWWKDNQNVYPQLFKLMKKRHCILAVPCERIFSKAGQTITEKRRLTSKNFEKMRFLNFNLISK